jgi:hypothetical protein
MIALPLLIGCGGGGSYELGWTLGCEKRPNDCQVKSATDCSSVGIDSIEVLATPTNAPNDTAIRTLFACFSSSLGPLGRGPQLSATNYSLEIYTLTPAGQRLTGPHTARADVPESGYGAAKVDLTLATRCADGVDNDQDGFVDLFDPNCSDEQDDDETR